jgi:hypothetical protein
MRSYRSFKELFAALELGKRPCGYPHCQGFGDVITQKYGIVCLVHARAEMSDTPETGQYLVAAATVADKAMR